MVIHRGSLSTITLVSFVVGIAGYVGAHLFTSVNPLYGGIVGAVGIVAKQAFERNFAQFHAQYPGIRDAVAYATSFAACYALGLELTLYNIGILTINTVVSGVLSVGALTIILNYWGCLPPPDRADFARNL